MNGIYATTYFFQRLFNSNRLGLAGYLHNHSSAPLSLLIAGAVVADLGGLTLSSTLAVFGVLGFGMTIGPYLPQDFSLLPYLAGFLWAGLSAAVGFGLVHGLFFHIFARYRG